MKKIVFALSVIVVVQAFLIFKPRDKDYSYYIQKYKAEQTKIDSLSNEVNKYKHEIISIKTKINSKDSIIDNADKSKVRELSSDFFARIR
jgi:hypothetical protein